MVERLLANRMKSLTSMDLTRSRLSAFAALAEMSLVQT